MDSEKRAAGGMLTRMENQFGRTSLCRITAGCEEGRTRLEDVEFTAPFKVMSPFYEKSGEMRVMLLSASAGIMEGDTQRLDIHVKQNACMGFMAQAYEKIHKMKEGYAKRTARIQVDAGGMLDYYSQPVIPFAGSAFTSTLRAELADESCVFCYQEILSCGRTAFGEEFAYRFYHNLVEVLRGQELIYRDNCYFEPGRMDMAGMGMYEGHHHVGTFLLFGKEPLEEQIEQIRKLLDADWECEGGVTLLSERDLAIRVLGNRAQHLEELFEKIKNIIGKRVF